LSTLIIYSPDEIKDSNKHKNFTGSIVWLIIISLITLLYIINYIGNVKRHFKEISKKEKRKPSKSIKHDGNTSINNTYQKKQNKGENKDLILVEEDYHLSNSSKKLRKKSYKSDEEKENKENTNIESKEEVKQVIKEIEENNKQSLLPNNPHSISSTTKSSFCENFISFFNFYDNLSKLFSPKLKSNDSLRIFDGVRFFSAGWVVFGHSFAFRMQFGFTNSNDWVPFLKDWKSSFILSGFFAVDSFFMMSGFLFLYAINTQLAKIKTQNKGKVILVAIVSRYFRLLPLYIFIIFGVTYIFPYFSDGTMDYLFNTQNDYCKTYWWHNLLYINNKQK